MPRRIIAFLFIFAPLITQAADLRTMKPATPADNDRLLAEYKSTKDTIYIRQMLKTYAESEDEILRNARRYAYFARQFDNPKNPRRELKKTTSIAACQKYDCASRSEKSKEFFTLSSGMWAIDLLSKTNLDVKVTVAEFLNGNKRMKKIYDEEGGLFSDYLTLSLVYVIQPEKVDSILTTYEKFGALDKQAVNENLNMKAVKSE